MASIDLFNHLHVFITWLYVNAVAFGLKNGRKIPFTTCIFHPPAPSYSPAIQPPLSRYDDAPRAFEFQNWYNLGKKDNIIKQNAPQEGE